MLQNCLVRSARVLAVQRLTKRYDDLLALDDVTFEVQPGQIVGFLGPNGAGKTTTMRAIMHLVELDSGHVEWDGRPVDADIRQRFGYMPAERGIYPRMRVRDHLVYYGRLCGLSAAESARRSDGWLERLGLGPRSSEAIENLSSGNQQRVQLALALLQEPELLVLDEPFSGLDPIAADMLRDVLRDEVARGAALLLSSHQLDLVADICSAVVIVDRGRVVLRGDVAELRAGSEVRIVELEFADATDWDGPTIGIDADGRRVRVEVDDESAAQAVIAHARSQGGLIGYSYAPPDLSEIFRRSVGRDTVEDPAHRGATDPSDGATDPSTADPTPSHTAGPR
jgi:ABC-2 type transport system ATP-binding protein